MKIEVGCSSRRCGKKTSAFDKNVNLIVFKGYLPLNNVNEIAVPNLREELRIGNNSICNTAVREKQNTILNPYP